MSATAWEILIALRDHVARHPELTARVARTYLFRFDDGARWMVDLKNGRGAVLEGGDGADCILELGERAFVDLATGAADPGDLVAAGTLVVAGDVPALQHLRLLQQLDPERARAAVAAARSAGQGPGVAPSESVTVEGLHERPERV